MARRGARILKLQPRWSSQAPALVTLPGPLGARGERPPMLPFLQEILDSFVEYDAESFGLDWPEIAPVCAEGPSLAVEDPEPRASRTA